MVSRNEIIRVLLDQDKLLQFYSKCIQEPMEIFKHFITKISNIHENGEQ